MNYALPLLGFALVHLLAVMSPGPTFLVIAGIGASGGTASTALVAAVASGFGAVVWASAALFGLQALLARFEWLYLGLRIAGGLYLVWLGIQLLRHAGRGTLDMQAGVAARPSYGRVFRDAFMVQLSNPKVAVFFGSVFLTLLPAGAPAWLDLTALGVVFANEFTWYLLVGLLFSRDLVRRFYRDARIWIERVTGGVLAILGLRLALER